MINSAFMRALSGSSQKSPHIPMAQRQSVEGVLGKHCVSTVAFVSFLGRKGHCLDAQSTLCLASHHSGARLGRSRSYLQDICCT